MLKCILALICFTNVLSILLAYRLGIEAAQEEHDSAYFKRQMHLEP